MSLIEENYAICEKKVLILIIIKLRSILRKRFFLMWIFLSLLFKNIPIRCYITENIFHIEKWLVLNYEI